MSDALADQLRDDLRSGALGRMAVALTLTRLVALATVTAIAVVVAAVMVGTHSSSAPPASQRAAASPGTVAPIDTDVATLVATMQANIQARYKHHSHVRLP
ncbi:MAG: hypothetical protein E6G14_03375 [Actinobacteria bacterium]|nr:MAG: hypothetical protein E6G14_03375 [Actinomycetota bacterium]